MEGIPAQGLSLAEHRERLAAARSSLATLSSVLWQTPSGGGPEGLSGLMGEVDALVMAGEAGRVAVLREAMNRGESSGGSAALTTAQWVRHHAPSTIAGGAAAIVSVATAFGKAVNAPVKEAVEAGRLPVRSAAVVVSEADKLRPLLADGAEPHVLEGLIGMAEQHGPSGCRLLRDGLIARYGREGLLQDQQNMGKSFVRLSQPQDTGASTFEYRLTLDVEGKAVLEAALGPLSVPKPVDGERDLRSSDRRRGDALITLVRRAVAAGDELGKTNKTTLLLTMSHEDLKDRLGAATTLGGLDAGTHLAPETVRRLCCDGSVIPIVLGADGEVMDWGIEKRFFTDAQTKRLWLRDGGCTYPGCGAPPQWTDAHHLVHWADLGPSNLTNAALLCERHHTIIHSRRLAGRVVKGPFGERVEWDLTRGSYDDLLARRAACDTATEPA
ncbi:HNH endonuclease signature motif containing protein [Phycicoccus sp. SLBN-51]|uniref:HNH endonuclease signature motif containing protein n=1 Tax=Phycicoccus sp. SLBN-51 TaxID=2768447 RepID=UPI0011548C21|nr:HNH endonuclease signature motif containing protein [Phycicoccus sp. SLBN-51]